MAELSYHPGTGTLLARDGAVLLLDTAATGEELTDLWDGLSGSRSDRLDTVLRSLVARHGVRRLPGFAFLDRTRGEMVLRAGVHVLRTASADDSDIVAPTSAAWIALPLDGTEVSLVVDGGTSDHDPTPALPFLGGIAMAARVDLEAGSGVSTTQGHAGSRGGSYMSLIIGSDAGEEPLRASDETRTWLGEPVETSEAPTPIVSADDAPGQLRLPDDKVLVLDRGVVFGRAPVAPEDAQPVPHLVHLTSHGRQVSRTHLDVLLQGSLAFVRDLGSTKGSEVTGPDGASEALRPYEAHQLQHGSVVSLAGAYSFRFEGR